MRVFKPGHVQVAMAALQKLQNGKAEESHYYVEIFVLFAVL